MSGLWHICYWGPGTRYYPQFTSLPPPWILIKILLQINLQKRCSKDISNDHQASQSHNLEPPRPRKTVKNKRNSMVSDIFPKCYLGHILNAFYTPRTPTTPPRDPIIHPKCHQSDHGGLQFPPMNPKCIPRVPKMTTEVPKETPNLPNDVPKNIKTQTLNPLHLSPYRGRRQGA